MVMDIFEFIKHVIEEIEVLEYEREGYYYQMMKVRYQNRTFIITDYGDGPTVTEPDEEDDDLE